MILLAWLACAEPQPLPPSDAELYLGALAEGDPAACAPIAGSSLRGECAAMLTRDIARAGDIDRAFQSCAAIEAGPWRDECFFLLADAAADAPQQARNLCGQAGRFRNQCIGHAISRAISAVINDMAPGTERETIETLHRAMEPYIPGAAGRQQRIEDVMARAIAGRLQRDHFDAGACGTAPDAICRRAYAERMRGAARHRGERDGAWRAACPPPVTTERAAALRLPTWAPALDTVIAEGWVELCR